MGSNDTKSSSEQVTPEQRLASYNAGMGAVEGGMGGAYQAPTTQQYAGYDGLKGERLSTDYGALRDELSKGYSAPLDYAKGQDVQNFNNSAGAKGIWSSGLALKGEQDINNGYAAQYAKAGADATNAATGYQAADIAQANQNKLAIGQMEQTGVAQDNANKLAIAGQQYESSWRPADYKAGIWNGTGGVNSSSNTSGWSI